MLSWSKYENMFVPLKKTHRGGGIKIPVGPVVLFRPGGAAISIKQVCCMESFLDRLLDTFSDVAPGALLEWMTPLHCGRFAAPLLSMRVTMMMAHVLGLRLTLDFLLGLRA